MVHLKTLVDDFGERGIGVYLICFAKKQSDKNVSSAYQQTLDVLDKHGCVVETLFNPQFDSGAAMHARKERVTWVVLPDRAIVYEGLLDFENEPKSLASVLEECLSGSPPSSLTQLSTAPAENPSATPVELSDAKDRLSKALRRMRVEHDDMLGITWYYEITSPRFLNTSAVFLYIGDNGQDYWLRFRVQYSGQDWLFIANLLFRTDGALHEVGTPYNTVKREVGYGYVCEWYDCAIDDSILEIARALAEADDAKMRYQGQNHYLDRRISSTEKRALRSLLEAYDALVAARRLGVEP